jgi:hypothetical protein
MGSKQEPVSHPAVAPMPHSWITDQWEETRHRENVQIADPTPKHVRTVRDARTDGGQIDRTTPALS